MTMQLKHLAACSLFWYGKPFWFGMPSKPIENNSFNFWFKTVVPLLKKVKKAIKKNIVSNAKNSVIIQQC